MICDFCPAGRSGLYREWTLVMLEGTVPWILLIGGCVSRLG